MSMQAQDDKPIVLDHKDAAKNLSMYAGDKKFQEISIYVYDLENNKMKHFYGKNNKMKFYSVALNKIVWEIISNSIDHWIRNQTGKNKVTFIKINFDKKNGKVSVMNDGKPISIVKEKINNEEELYRPEVIFTKLHSGTNFQKKTHNSTTGGLNGIGAKLTNLLSSLFEIEILNVEENKYYFQTCKNKMDIIGEPIIKNLSEHISENKKKYKNISSTKISFIPDYEFLAKDQFDFKKNKDIFKNILNDLELQIQTMALLSSVFTGIDVFYNDLLINVKKLDDFSNLFFTESEKKFKKLETTIKYKGKNLDAKNIKLLTIVNDINIPNVSIVNGIFPEKGGVHIDFISETIFDALLKKTKSKMKKLKDNDDEIKKLISNYCSFFAILNIGEPQFSGQTKERLQSFAEEFEEVFEFDKKYFKEIWEELEKLLDDKFFTVVEEEAKTSTKIKKLDAEYKDALYASSSSKDLRKNCMLFLAEGSSALKTVQRMINDDPKNFNKSWSKDQYLNPYFSGYISLGGVNLNSRANSTRLNNFQKLIESKYDDEKELMAPIFRADKKLDLDKKQTFTNIMTLLGLKYNCSYSTDLQKETLRYSKLIIVSDQDLDGNNICSLVLIFIMTYFPNLCRSNFIYRLVTPVIRCYLKNNLQDLDKAECFYDIETYLKFFESLPEKEKSKYVIEYYKGLAKHTAREIQHMIKGDINQYLRLYFYDKETENTIELFFGDDADKRKIELSNPNLIPNPYSQYEEAIPMSIYLKYDQKSYHLDRLQRGIPFILDGFNRTQRLIFSAIKHCFKTNDKKMKVFQFGGYVAEHMKFHHGDATLNGTIVFLAQNYYIGGSYYKVLLGQGEFGLRSDGGSSGSPRYIEVAGNLPLVELLFPSTDDIFLPDNIIDGEAIGKKYYIPTLPYYLMRYFNNPAVGWKILSTTRSLTDILENVRIMIKNSNKKFISVQEMADNKILLNDNNVILGPLRREMYGYDHQLIVQNNKNGRKKIVELEIANFKILTVGEMNELESELNDKKKNKKEKDDSTKNKKLRKTFQKDREILFISSLPQYVYSKNYIEWVTEKMKDSENIVDTVIDTTNDYETHIEIYLKKDWRNFIPNNDGEILNAAIIEKFNLKDSLSLDIVAINKNYGVTVYNNYYEILYEWFEERKNLFIKVGKRNLVILKIKLELEENIIRYLNEYKKFDFINKNLDISETDKILSNANYQKFNKSLLENNDIQIEIDEKDEKEDDEEFSKKLDNYLRTKNVSYSYIYNLTIAELTFKNNIESRLNKIKNLKKEIERILSYKNFIGDQDWLDILDKLEEICKKGLKHNWEIGYQKLS